MMPNININLKQETTIMPRFHQKQHILNLHWHQKETSQEKRNQLKKRKTKKRKPKALFNIKMKVMRRVNHLMMQKTKTNLKPRMITMLKLQPKTIILNLNWHLRVIYIGTQSHKVLHKKFMRKNQRKKMMKKVNQKILTTPNININLRQGMTTTPMYHQKLPIHNLQWLHKAISQERKVQSLLFNNPTKMM